jgi:intracellular septation protein
MDRRLLLELLPGIVFLLANLVADLFVATAAASVAGAVAVALQWRMDRTLPWLAVASVVLAVVLLGIGLAFEDERFLKIRPTVGYLAFAGFIALGALARPSLLARTFKGRLRLLPSGWVALHWAWTGLLVAFAGLNEAIWRLVSTETWIWWATVDSWLSFAAIYAATWGIAWWYWDEDAASAPAGSEPGE